MEQYDVQQIARLSKKVVELERKIDFILEKLNLEYIDKAPPPQFPEVERLLEKGDKLGAIKVYQLNTGAGLAEAKAAVEAIQRQLLGY